MGRLASLEDFLGNFRGFLMYRQKLKVVLKRAIAARAALPAFNMPSLDFCWLTAKISASTGLPLIIQTSSRVARHYGPSVVAGIIKSLNQSGGVRVYLHLDHCEDLELIKSSIDAGYDSVMVDGSSLPIE